MVLPYYTNFYSNYFITYFMNIFYILHRIYFIAFVAFGGILYCFF
jgi:hypothetical protein